MGGDLTGDFNLGQLIAPPADAAAQPSWLRALQAWRSSCLGVLDDSIYDDETLSWTQTSFVHVQMHPFDRFFWHNDDSDGDAGHYNVSSWLADLRERFGGIDAALLWPTYPMLGIDDRNAYDMIRSMPGGLDGIRQVVHQLHAEGVRVLWPFMPWDTETRYEGAEPASIVTLVRETGADGINGDTLYTIPEAFSDEGVARGQRVALQPELGGSLGSLGWTTLGWGEAGGWSSDALTTSPAPAVDLFKWLSPRRMTTVCRRWDQDRNDALQHAWFNGIGYVAWENVWGIWNGITPRDGEALRRLQPLMRYLGESGYLSSEAWEPHAPTLQPTSVFASRFPQSVRHGDGRRTAWTLVERANSEWPSATPMLELDAAAYEGFLFWDLYNGVALSPTPSPRREGAITLSVAIEARGFGCVLAVPADEPLVLADFLTERARVTAAPLSAYDAEWRAARQVPVGPTLQSIEAWPFAPPDAKLVPATASYDFKCEGTVIEPFEADRRATFGIDVRFDFEPLATNEHEQRLSINSFYLDRTPVGMARYARYLKATAYAPEDPRNYLREWPDWRSGKHPPGNETVPVTGVSLDEARRFCHWAGGRLPTSIEWQYAAQAGDPANKFPWGAEDDEAKRPKRVRGGRTPAPTSSEALLEGANAWGLVDLVGNVWEWTDSEFTDEHTRFALLRGGSAYQPVAASDFQNWYFGAIRRYANDRYVANESAAQLDRHAKFFRFAGAGGAAYERSATVGFRCAYNHATTAPEDAESSMAPAGIFSILLVAVLATAHALANRARRKRHDDAAAAVQELEDEAETDDEL